MCQAICADRAEAGLVFGLLAAGRATGIVGSGPLSEALLSEQPWVGDAMLRYGIGYGALIAFTRVSAMLDGMNWAGGLVGSNGDTTQWRLTINV